MNDVVAARGPTRGEQAARFREALRRDGLLLAGPVPGVYGLGEDFERVVVAVGELVGGLADAGAEIMRFPPVMGRSAFEATRYFANFPQLAGTVHCFCGDDDEHARLLECVATGQDWTAGQQASEVVLTPASCYPVYGIIAGRGRLPQAGWVVDSSSWCFRHEPSDDPIRMLSFRQREQVFLGTEAQIEEHARRWTERSTAMFAALMLPAEFQLANDPFFGRIGRLTAQGQKAQRLKHEFVVPITDPEKPDACGSFNRHGAHFAHAFGILGADGATARTACAGFGLERLALALFRHHGFRIEGWPHALRKVLWPGE